jgi:peptidoglycan/xylan/chitin deacetylase (PgdA/CDA1 family)
MIGLAAAGVAMAGLAAHGTWHRNSWIFGKPLTHLPGPTSAVSITFDDGPNPRATPVILDVLRREQVRATFFVLGRHADRWTELVRVWDSARPGADEIVRRALAGMRAGSILLMHDGDGYDEEGDRMQTAVALPRIIEGLRARGHRFVTLPDPPHSAA